MPTPSEQIAARLEEKLRKSKNKARVEDLVEDLTNSFGGTKKIADRFVAEFNDGKPGGIGRAKLLDAYTRLLTLTSKKETTRPVAELSEEESLAMLNELVHKAIEATPIVIDPEVAHGEKTQATS